MTWDEHLSVAAAALAAGFVTREQIEETMLALRKRGGKGTLDEVWIGPGLLDAQQLNELSRSLPRARTLPLGALGRPPRGSVPPLDNGPRGSLSGRYQPVNVLGGGGMGEVTECLDRHLGRRVAVKALRAELVNDASAARMLQREARIISQLEHPGIIPVYDVETDANGAPRYVMRLVKQPTLEDVLWKLRDREPRAMAEHGVARLLRDFLQVCEAIEYAHRRGVIHCDLKPANILLGEFGEVLVVDWGLAYKVDEGTVYRGGTPGYLAPEQLAPLPEKAPIDARTDIFALGAILYEILSLRSPFAHVTTQRVLDAISSGISVFDGPPPPPSLLSPERGVPDGLDDIALRAVALDRDARWPSVRAMASAIEEILEGSRERERRRQRAEHAVAGAEDAAAYYFESIATRGERLAEVRERRAEVPSYAPPERKKAVWDAEDRLAAMDLVALRQLQAAVAGYEQALDETPGYAPARQGLARLYRAEARRAAERRDDAGRAYFTALAREHDETARDAQLVTIQTIPAGAPVLVAPLEERERRLVPGLSRPPGELAHGSWIARAGRVVAPFVVHDEAVTLLIDLEESVGARPGEIYVPGGPALVTAGAVDGEGAALEAVDVASFFIDADPVTFAAYLMYAARVGEAAWPRRGDGEPLWRLVDGRPVPAAVLEWGGDAGDLLALPVHGVSAAQAAAYAAWLAATTGLPHRLPTELEWEKAARGVDGRRYPWGHRFDASFCRMRQSSAGAPRPGPTGAFAADVSPYGVRDVAGGFADWATPRDAAAVARAEAVARGGAWCDWSAECALDARRVYPTSEPSLRVSFRLARKPRGP